MPLFIVG